ncbi:MAG TPA: molybdate ABC transporter permease subunit [Terriglobales bacterium]|jgi:molybdate transport system permease protein|nr:molybdate ABC transporter permease subunit [Terriglobales bacterium]
MNWSAICLSLRLAATVCVVLLLVGAPLAYWIAFSHRRWKFLVEAVVALPLVLPPTVLGYYMLVALGPRSPLGSFAESVLSTRLTFSFPGLVIASVLYSLPFAVQPMANAFGSVDPRLLDAAAVLGASRWRRFRTITLPLAKAGVVTGAVLSFAHTLGEFGVVLMVGGNIPGVTQTISIAIYDEVQALDYAVAARTSALLLIFSFVTLALVYALNRRSSLWWSSARNA